MPLPGVAQRHRSFCHVAPKYFQRNGEILKLCFYFTILSDISGSNCSVLLLQMTANASHLADESSAEIQVNKVDTSYCNMGSTLSVWPTVVVAVKDPVNFLHLN